MLTVSTDTGAVSVDGGVLEAVEAGPFSFDVNVSDAAEVNGESGWDVLEIMDTVTTHLRFSLLTTINTHY